jgi:hypothetical protein
LKPKIRKRIWTRESAIDWLVKKQGAKLIDTRIIHKDSTFTGLKTCSAIDYLRNVHGFAVRSKWEKETVKEQRWMARIQAVLKTISRQWQGASTK